MISLLIVGLVLTPLLLCLLLYGRVSPAAWRGLLLANLVANVAGAWSFALLVAMDVIRNESAPAAIALAAVCTVLAVIATGAGSIAARLQKRSTPDGQPPVDRDAKNC